MHTKSIELLVPVSLHALPAFHTWPINVVVFHGSHGKSSFEGASRLDAFSGYPVRT